MSQYRTPLRYPGGKQRLTPFVLEILKLNEINGHYVEPYAGGAGVAMELLLSKQIENVHLNDSDLGIYSFWHSVLNHTEEFCRMIAKASFTVEEWRRHQRIVRGKEESSTLELGFSFFFLNRCNRSGVINAGVIGGLDQTGNYKMDARFKRSDLIQRIENIGTYKDQIHLSNMDAELYVRNYIPNLPYASTLIYLDPPYFVKGGDLYYNFYKKSDHTRIAELIQDELNHMWILSYDGVPDIIDLYNERRYFTYLLQYTAGKVYKGSEVFIFSDQTEIPESSCLKHINVALTESSTI